MCSDDNFSNTPDEVNEMLRKMFNEMHTLLAKSKSNPSVEVSQQLVECFQKMDSLQKMINKKIDELRS